MPIATQRIIIDLPHDLEVRLLKMTESIGAESPAETIRDALRVFEHLIDLDRQGYRFLQTRDGVQSELPLFSQPAEAKPE